MGLLEKIKKSLGVIHVNKNVTDSVDIFESAPRRNFVIYLKESHEYTKYNMLFDEAKRKHPGSIKTLNKGKIIYSQDKEFTQEQIDVVREHGFHYQWGFGPCAEKIPYERIKFSKLI